MPETLLKKGNVVDNDYHSGGVLDMFPKKVKAEEVGLIIEASFRRRGG